MDISPLILYSVAVVLGPLVSGLLHPGQSQASLDQKFEELATELRQNLSSLQHQVFASETQALRQILTQERGFRQELEQEMADFKANVSAYIQLMNYEIINRQTFEQVMNSRLQNLTDRLRSVRSDLDNAVVEQQQLGILLGTSITNSSQLRTAVSQQFSQLTTTVTQTRNKLTSLDNTLQGVMQANRPGSSDGSTVAFTAYASTGKTTYTSEVVIFNEIITNQGGAYSKSTGIFTCPTEGVYAFTWTHLIHAGNYCHAYLYKNGAQQNLDAHSNLQGMSSTSVVYTMASMSGTLHLSRGDHVWIHSTHCESFMNTPYNSFSGWKL